MFCGSTLGFKLIRSASIFLAVVAAVTAVNGQSWNAKHGQEREPSENRKDLRAPLKAMTGFPARRLQPVNAVNGEAFKIVENPIGSGVDVVAIKTSLPVFKAFALTADQKELLYIPLINGIPSGRLIFENLATGEKRQVTSRIVLSASLSPSDDNFVAYTFASGESFGLAVADMSSGESRVLVPGDVQTGTIAWDRNGTGLHYIEISRRESKLKQVGIVYFEDPSTIGQLDLTTKFVSLDSSISTPGFLSPAPPEGFPLLENGQEDSLRPAGVPSGNRFRLISEDRKFEVLGNDFLSPAELSLRERATGRTVTVAKGQLEGIFESGIVVRDFGPKGASLSYVDLLGNSTSLGATTVDYNLPLKSSVMIQGGSSYSSPGNCGVTAHVQMMDYAYDFQNTVVGEHVLASADGLVVYNTSSVACNSIDTTGCADYSPGGCPGTFLGNVVILQHADGSFSKYAHMEENSPQTVVGTSVDQGLYIGRQGHTGSTNGSFNGCGDHLHFQLQSNPDIFGQSIPVDFADVAAEPLSCGVSYTSASTEISHSISPSSQNFGIAGGSGFVNVTSTGGTWSAVSNDNWITITSPGSGIGNDVVGFDVADNSASGDRTGTIHIGGHVFTVIQTGGGITNLAPVVDAGTDQSITLPSTSVLSGSASDDGLPNPPGSISTTWSKLSGPGSVVFGDVGALNTTADFSAPGIYILRLTVDDGALVSTDDVEIVVNISNGGGVLIGNAATRPTSVDLTSEGIEDWAHWGLISAGSFNHKNGVTPAISNLTTFGPITPLRYLDPSHLHSWSDGIPTSSVSNTNTGLVTYDQGNGFQLTVPADTTPRTLKIYLSVFEGATGRLEATLSDGSASPHIGTINPSGSVNRVYTLDYSAASAGQTLTIRWFLESPGSIAIQAATLVSVPLVNQAPVVNAGADQSVTLPAQANLGGSVSDDGLPNPPASFTTTWSTVSGPGTVTFGDANAVNTTADFSTDGTYVLRLTGDDSVLTGADDVQITVNPGGAGPGTLSYVNGTPLANVDLTSDGHGDWANWGLFDSQSFNRKNGVAQQISNYTQIGSGTVGNFTDGPTTYGWNDGAPVVSADYSGSGVYVSGVDNGFELNVPADTMTRTLKVYVGLFAAQGRFEASLSDGSAPVVTDTSVTNQTGTTNRVFTIDFRAASSGQNLNVKWTSAITYNQYGNVTLQAASLMDGNSAPPIPTEFQISSSARFDQLATNVARNANGDTVVTWQSNLQDGSGWGIFARRFDANGNSLGPEFQVNTLAANDQFVSSTALDASGNFVIVWESDGGDGDGFGVLARRFDSSGVPFGPEFQVNTNTLDTQNNPAIAMDPIGNFVVVWSSNLQDGSLSGVFGQRFDSAGVPQGPEFQVNTYNNDQQNEVKIAMDANGNFVVGWVSAGQDGSGTGIFGQLFDAAGNPVGGEFQVNTTFLNDQFAQSPAMSPSGEFVFVWSSAGQDGSASGVFGQRYDASGSPQGNEFQINTFSSSDQIFPSVSMDVNKDFVAVWESQNQDGGGRGIYGQRFDSLGSPQGVEFGINSFTNGDQSNPFVANDGVGNFVVVWSSSGQDGAGRGVFGKRFDHAGNPLDVP